MADTGILSHYILKLLYPGGLECAGCTVFHGAVCYRYFGDRLLVL